MANPLIFKYRSSAEILSHGSKIEKLLENYQKIWPTYVGHFICESTKQFLDLFRSDDKSLHALLGDRVDKIEVVDTENIVIDSIANESINSLLFSTQDIAFASLTVSVEQLQGNTRLNLSLKLKHRLLFLSPFALSCYGRNLELEQIEKALNSNKPALLAPVKGLECKLGKSAIASRYIEIHKEEYEKVLWIDASSDASIRRNYQLIAKEMELENSDLAAVVRYLSNQSKWLIFFDGVTNPYDLNQQEVNLVPKCSCILTSRHRDWQGFNVTKIEVGRLSIEDATQLLLNETKSNDQKAAKKIAKKLDCLPTSLMHAVSYIIEKDISLSDYPQAKEDDLNVTANTLKENDNVNLPSHNTKFVGRERSLVALEETLQDSGRLVITGKRRVAANTGLGGVGKTQIALQYAYRNAHHYSKLIWWINCENIRNSYESLAKALDIQLIDEEKKVENALINKVNCYLESQSDWLLIFDNAFDEESIVNFLPKSGGHVLITSRDPNWKIGSTFSIGVFDRRESIELIRKIVPSNSAIDAGEIAELLGDLPLALAQAAAYMQQTRANKDEYVGLFNTYRACLLPSQEPTDEFTKTVNVTWKVSMDKIAELEKVKSDESGCPESMARPLMDLCSFFASSGIPKELLLLEWAKQAFPNREEAALGDLDGVLDLLGKFSMISLDEKEVDIHPLVQTVTGDSLDQQNRIQKFKEAAHLVAFQIERFNDIRPDTWSIGKCLQIHAEHIVCHSLCLYLNLEYSILIYSKLGSIKLTFSSYSEALKDLEKVLKLNRALYKNEPNVIISASLNNLGLVLEELSRYEEALKIYREALDVTKSCGNTPNSYMSISLNSIGNALATLGRYEEAFESYNEALLVMEAIYEDKGHSNIVACLNNLGFVLEKLGRTNESKDCYLKTVNMHITLFGTEPHPVIALQLQKEAKDLEEKHHYNEALELCLKALEMNEKLYAGTTHKILVTSLNYVGGVLIHLNSYNEALGYHEKALELTKTLYGNEASIELAFTLSQMGIVFKKLKRYTESIACCQQGLEAYTTLYKGQSHPDIAFCFYQTGAALKKLGRYNEALDHYYKALQMQKDLSRSKPNHELTVYLAAIGRLHIKLNQDNEALTRYEEALKIQEELYSNQAHAEIATSLGTIGYILGSLGRYEEEMDHQNRALEMRKLLFSDNPHIDLADSYDLVGTALFDLERHEEALDSYQLGLQIKRVLFQDEPCSSLSISLNNIGQTLFILKRYEEALNFFKENLELEKQLYQQISHPNQADSLIFIGETLERLDCYNEALDYRLAGLKMQNELDKTDPITLHNLGSIYVVLSQSEYAEKYFIQSIAADPRSGSYCELGLLLFNQGEYEKAIEKLQKSLELKDDNGGLSFNMIEIQALEEDLKKRVQQLKKVQMNASIYACKLLVDCYTKINRSDETKMYIEQLANLVKDNPSSDHQYLLECAKTRVLSSNI